MSGACYVGDGCGGRGLRRPATWAAAADVVLRWVMEGQRGLDDALGCGTVVAVFVELVCGERILDGKGSEDGGQQHAD
nr:unnamed protein product [Digitaria exilis]